MDDGRESGRGKARQCLLRIDGRREKPFAAPRPEMDAKNGVNTPKNRIDGRRSRGDGRRDKANAYPDGQSIGTRIVPGGETTSIG